MNSTTLDIIIALSMMALCAVLIVWFFKNLASDSEKRMTHMMKVAGWKVLRCHNFRLMASRSRTISSLAT